ncbi:MAG: hypothetical protein J6N18_08320, partial [Kiritimatiellae bacterium]|nr:hypothetical protein [Kiritimatiellia bacterium]
MKKMIMLASMKKVLLFAFAISAAVANAGLLVECEQSAGKGGWTVDTELPAGNAVIEKIEGDTVRLKQDLRDSGLWFYWAFRVTEAAGKTVTFQFAQKNRVGYWGA